MGSLKQVYWQRYREQREFFEAAKVIQSAYRQYKQRLTQQRQLETERRAAVVIQTYYRRYRQTCAFKRLHQAAACIQRHFRQHKATKGKPDSDRRSALNDQTKLPRQFVDALNQLMDCDTLDKMVVVRDSTARFGDLPHKLSPSRQHLAAARIQQAFRIHRRRNAAAKTIQKFMRLCAARSRTRQKARITKN